MSVSPAASFAMASVKNCDCRSNRTRHVRCDRPSQSTGWSKASLSSASSARRQADARYLTVLIASNRGRKSSFIGHMASSTRAHEMCSGDLPVRGAKRAVHLFNSSPLSIPSLHDCVGTPIIEKTGPTVSAARTRIARRSASLYGLEGWA